MSNNSDQSDISDSQSEASESDNDDNIDYCRVCKDGGRLLLCDTCPHSFHLRCCKPQLLKIPKGNWKCHFCRIEPLPGAVEMVLTWRWKEEADKNNVSGKFFEILHALFNSLHVIECLIKQAFANIFNYFLLKELRVIKNTKFCFTCGNANCAVSC